MRLIDADALIEFWKADFTEEEIHKLRIPLVVAIENIKDAPIVDAVQVVRCKDCRYFHENVFGDEIGMGRPYDCLIVGHCCCEFWGRKNDHSMSQTSPEGFCSFGERKSE